MSAEVDSDTLLLGSPNNSTRRLHIPNSENSGESICRYSGKYRPKPAAAVVGHFELCPECARKEGDDV